MSTYSNLLAGLTCSQANYPEYSCDFSTAAQPALLAVLICEKAKDKARPTAKQANFFRWNQSSSSRKKRVRRMNKTRRKLKHAFKVKFRITWTVVCFCPVSFMLLLFQLWVIWPLTPAVAPQWWNIWFMLLRNPRWTRRGGNFFFNLASLRLWTFTVLFMVTV